VAQLPGPIKAVLRIHFTVHIRTELRNFSSSPAYILAKVGTLAQSKQSINQGVEPFPFKNPHALIVVNPPEFRINAQRRGMPDSIASTKLQKINRFINCANPTHQVLKVFTSVESKLCMPMKT